MDDVYISDPRQASAQAIAQKQKDKQNSLKRRNFGQYLFDLFVKTLICSGLIAIDFTLFAESGSYNLFDINQVPTIEAQFIYAGIVAICFVIMLLLSFSAFMQNIFISAAFAGLVLAIFNQFALFDQSSILYGLFSSYIDSSISGVFIHHSDLLIAGIVALTSLVLISYTSRSNQIYLLGTILLILGGVISEAYFNPLTRNFDNKKALQAPIEKEEGRNFIFLALPNLSSYADIKGIDNKNYTINMAADNLLGLYTVNKFTHYPNAYVNQYGNDFINLVETFNPSTTENIEDNLLENVMLESFWDFKNLDTDKLYLKNNELYKQLIKQDYNIKAFQTRGIELCSVNNNISVSKCVEKINYPINLNQSGLSKLDKTVLLTAQWLESTKILSNINLPLLAASYLTKEVSPLNFSGSELYPVNSYKILDLILDDIKAAKGNNAYIAIIDLPSSTYVYDDFCNLKNPFQWNGAKQQPWIKSNSTVNKQQAYAEQTNCLIGQMENFMQELKRAGKLDKTIIVIQGISPSGIFMNKTQNLKDFKRVGLAIYQPQQEAKTRYELCPASKIIEGFLNKSEKCEELFGQNTTDKRRNEILEEAHKNTITEQRLFNSTRRFKEWYQAFSGHNQYQNDLGNQETVKPEAESPKEEDAKEIAEVEATAVAEELPPEEDEKSISEAIKETLNNNTADKGVSSESNKDDTSKEQVKQDENQTSSSEKKDSQETSKAKTESKKETTKEENAKEIPLTKPEQLKKEYKEKQQAQQKNEKEKETSTSSDNAKVSIKVDVIDTKEETMDVVPPALLGETQYKPTSTTE